jgi:hypothetical protein
MATTKRPAKKVAKKGATKAAKPSKPAKTRSAPRTSTGRELLAANPPPRVAIPYAIRLEFQQYIEFAKRLTTGALKPYYQRNPNSIASFIELSLANLGADVLFGCEEGNIRKYDPDTDKIRVDIDRPNEHYTVSIPSYICEIQVPGQPSIVDIEYLKSYAREIKRSTVSDEDAAWALLGMYFLSRCR